MDNSSDPIQNSLSDTAALSGTEQHMLSTDSEVNPRSHTEGDAPSLKLMANGGVHNSRATSVKLSNDSDMVPQKSREESRRFSMTEQTTDSFEIPQVGQHPSQDYEDAARMFQPLHYKARKNSKVHSGMPESRRWTTELPSLNAPSGFQHTAHDYVSGRLPGQGGMYNQQNQRKRTSEDELNDMEIGSSPELMNSPRKSSAFDLFGDFKTNFAQAVPSGPAHEGNSPASRPHTMSSVPQLQENPGWEDPRRESVMGDGSNLGDSNTILAQLEREEAMLSERLQQVRFQKRMIEMGNPLSRDFKLIGPNVEYDDWENNYLRDYMASLPQQSAPSSAGAAATGQNQTLAAAVLSKRIRNNNNFSVGQAGNLTKSNALTGPPGANLFVFNFPRHFTDNDLCREFQPFGTVLSATVFIDKATGRSKCFGFVSYDNVESGRHAIRTLNGCQMGGKIIKVQLKREGGSSFERERENSLVSQTHGTPYAGGLNPFGVAGPVYGQGQSGVAFDRQASRGGLAQNFSQMNLGLGGYPGASLGGIGQTSHLDLSRHF